MSAVRLGAADTSMREVLSVLHAGAHSERATSVESIFNWVVCEPGTRETALRALEFTPPAPPRGLGGFVKIGKKKKTQDGRHGACFTLARTLRAQQRELQDRLQHHIPSERTPL